MTAQMFVGLLVEGAILAVPLILIAFLLSRFIRDIIGRSLLVEQLPLAVPQLRALGALEEAVEFDFTPEYQQPYERD